MVKSSSAPYCFVSGLADRSTCSTPSKYILAIRQQPQRAKVCGKERDRRPIDPPPIVQIKLADPASDRNCDYLQSPYLFMCCNLVRVDDPDGDLVAPAHRALAGTVVSSLNRLKDIDNSDGGFFVFGDMSARIEGHFRLRFTLFEMVEGQVVHVMSTISDPWTAYSSKTFPGVCESTFLSRCFSDQGVRIRIRKDHHVKPKNASPETSSVLVPLHSPPSSCYDMEQSDDGMQKSKRPRAAAPASPHHYPESYTPKHLSTSSGPMDGRQYSAEPAPYYQEDHYNHQDSTRSRHGHDPFYREYHSSHDHHGYSSHGGHAVEPRSRSPIHNHSHHPHPPHHAQSNEGEYSSLSSLCDRRLSDNFSRRYTGLESWSSSQPTTASSSPSMYHPSGSDLNHHSIHRSFQHDSAMNSSPASPPSSYQSVEHHAPSGHPSDSQYQYGHPYHSRTPSMSSQHSESNISPPGSFSPCPSEATPLALPSISRMAMGKVQLPPIHTLYAR
ncbi:hypothetical protein BG004_007147 [Podila humilis]|nr:hypothetical protein BG004_007147 [Podila humilis]